MVSVSAAPKKKYAVSHGTDKLHKPRMLDYLESKHTMEIKVYTPDVCARRVKSLMKHMRTSPSRRQRRSS
jgi:hypothetical protein